MDEEMFLINEVANLHKITRKTLHYYDRIGLFSPEYSDEETGYRYYSRKQFPYLKQIIYFKDLGFTLTEIKQMLETRDFDYLIGNLKERHQQVEKEFKLISQRKKDLEFLLSFYDRVQHLDERDLNKPAIKLFDERRIALSVSEGNVSKKNIMLAYRVLLRELIEKDIFSQMEYGTIYPDPLNIDEKAGSFIRLSDGLRMNTEQILPSGKYVCMYKKGGYHSKQALIEFLEWIKNEGYEVDGPILDFCLVDYTFTNSEDEMIQQYQVKVR
ncbi:MerR family transcriptional regulator [Erysipelothrix urinaevulpis]|uniref:MerR family transcriptional regulator n=1 Tax=Erysipelothrix urinaevulpis TaxID=2683717 RepID=UPI001356D72B|nr:MerR family transcriptional regulator [Erysipelothrix urinaevulpis]